MFKLRPDPRQKVVLLLQHFSNEENHFSYQSFKKNALKVEIKS